MTECEVLCYEAMRGIKQKMAVARHIANRKFQMGERRFRRLVVFDLHWPALEKLTLGVDPSGEVTGYQEELDRLSQPEFWQNVTVVRHALCPLPRFDQTNPKPVMVEFSESSITISNCRAYILSRAMQVAEARDEPSNYVGLAEALQSALSEMGVGSVLRQKRSSDD